MMSVAWTVLLTMLIAGERMLARRAPAAQAVGVLRLVLGIALAAAPVAVIGPASSHARHSMAMRGD